MNSYKVEAMFPQPFSVEHLTLDVKSIADFCYNVKNNKDVGREISNAGGWQSNNVDIKSIENVEFTKLLDEIGIAINKVSSDIGIIPELDISNLWININQYNNHNIPHFHHGSILSGTFYVKIPENAGNIKFKNPVAPLMESYLNFWHFKESELRYLPWLVSNLIFPCEENMMIIFPSWIEHSVDRNLNVNEDRISISFNTKRKEEK
jgi:uncharacterized protein (TIGR02466 family)